MRLDDPALVRREYATETRLAGRAAAYQYATGPDPRTIAFDAVAECRPQRVLDVAAWMLYHVPDVPRALSELARVLRPRGRLVAVTNGADHARELWELLGVQRPPSSFSAENGEALLRERFEHVERREASGWIEFPDRAAAQEFVDATAVLWSRRHELPPVDGPLRVRRAPVVFVADKA